MAVDKLVDSTQLDADLEDVADAIRAKGGTSAALAFPAGFISAVQAIPTGGGGYTNDDFGELSNPVGAVTVTTAITSSNQATYSYYWKGRSGLTTVSLPNAVQVPDFYFNACSVTGVSAPNVQILGSNAFNGCTALQCIVLPAVTTIYTSAFTGCSNLATADFGGTPTSAQGFIRTTIFQNCAKLKTLILRAGAIWALSNVADFQNTPFASGKSGGTIYIPKSLYDHLGDGTSLDYKAATNWSTVDGYGTITWAQIEGSIYATQYADGTPIT